MERKMELTTVSEKEKRNHQKKKLKNTLGFAEVFVHGSDNFNTSGPSDHDESKM